MRVGFTYDLRDEYLAQGYGEEETAELDRPETIRAITAAIERLGHTVDPIGHAHALAGRLAEGERWDLVFNIAEGLYGLGREALVPALLDSYRVPYVFSDPLVLALTLHKGMTKHVVRAAGVSTPDFAVVESPADLDEVTLAYPLFAKPVAEGTGKGISAASNAMDPGEMRAVCLDLLLRFAQPVLVERYLPGREFTVGILGTGRQAEALGAMEVVLGDKAEAGAYTFLNKEHYEDRVTYALVDGPIGHAVTDVALAAWRALGCRDGGRIDIRLDEHGDANFIEVNPLAGLNPVRSYLAIMARLVGMGFDNLIASIMRSAASRLRPSVHA